MVLTTPWFRHRAHFGVRWYRSDAARKKNAGGRAPKTGCCDIRFVISTPPGKLIVFRTQHQFEIIIYRLSLRFLFSFVTKQTQWNTVKSAFLILFEQFIVRVISTIEFLSFFVAQNTRAQSWKMSIGKWFTCGNKTFRLVKKALSTKLNFHQKVLLRNSLLSPTNSHNSTS